MRLRRPEHGNHDQAEITIKPDGRNELDPCLYQEMETYENVTVHILRCVRCGHIEVEWERQDNTIDITEVTE